MTEQQIQDITKEMGIDAVVSQDGVFTTLNFYNPTLKKDRFVTFQARGFGIYPGDGERIVRNACEQVLKDLEQL